MKRIKRFASLLVAMIMVLTMALPAFAADQHPHTITVKQTDADNTVHTYEAYQIFKGDFTTVDGKKVLSNIEWGSNIDATQLLIDLQADKTIGSYFVGCETAAQVAEALGKTTKVKIEGSDEEKEENIFKDSDLKNSTLTDTFAKLVEKNLKGDPAGTGKTATTTDADGKEIVASNNKNVVINVTGSGYYLIKDQDGEVDTANGAYTRFLLEVVDDAEATVKSEVPSGDKEIFDPAGSNGATTDANYGAAIGTHVSYKITSKVPNHVGYETYFFVMNDTLSEGLTFDGVATVAVTVGGEEKTQGTDYVVYTETDAKVGDTQYTFRLAFLDIMSENPGDEIVVTYSATINNAAVIGNTGNPNTWDLTYSNNPYDTEHGTPNDENNPKPGLPLNESTNPLGKTPEEKTLTYLTELDITKTDAQGALLKDATFTLTGTSRQVVLKDVEYYKEWTKGDVYYKLADGGYTMDVPTGTEYKEIGVGDDDTTTGYLKGEGENNYYIPNDRKEYKGQTIYAQVKGTADKYADVNQKYELVKATAMDYVDVPISIELTSKDVENSVMIFKGLGAGEYTLTETVTPAGYNTIDPIEFEIKFTAPTNKEGKVEVLTGEEECTWAIKVTKGQDIVDFGLSDDGVSTSGIFATNVVNNSGSLLPSTGGIGTTIFYVVGGILVVAAGILLVTKKRMSAR